MTTRETESQILARVKGWFEEALLHPAYTAWRAEAKEAWDFYDGKQWSDEEKAKLAEHGQAAIVINKIAAKIDNLAGQEVTGRTRIVYRSRNGNPREEALALAMTEAGLYVAERADFATEVSYAFRSSLVAGIGWLDVGLEEDEGGSRMFFRAEDEMSLVWDPYARREDLSDARFVARERWLQAHEVQALFPEKAARVMALSAGQQGAARALFGRDEGVVYYDAAREVFRMVEVQYLVPCRSWRVRDAEGRVRTVRDAKEAQAKGVTVESEFAGSRVMVAYFAGDVLLDNRELEYDFGGFTVVPVLYKRERRTGQPYGLVRMAIDPQRELNKRRSKAMHLLNTAQVIADVDAVDDPQVLAREAARPDGIILKRAGKDLRILRNTDLALTQVSIMEQAGRDIQEGVGVFDEAMGKPSNATSGVAIQHRQMAGSLNQMLYFDNLRKLKRIMGLRIMATVPKLFSQERLLRLTDNPEAVVMLENVSMEGLVELGLDVVVEEARDVLTTRDYESKQLQMLMEAGVPVPPELLVEASAVRNKGAIMGALKAQKENVKG